MDFKFDRPQKNYTQEKAILICKSTVQRLVYLMVFLAPLFFLTDTVDFFDYNKQYLIWVFTGLICLIWFSRMVLLEKRVIWKKTPFDIPVLIFLGVNFLIYLFSVDRYISFWGNYGVFAQSFANILAMVLLFFAITNNF